MGPPQSALWRHHDCGRATAEMKENQFFYLTFFQSDGSPSLNHAQDSWAHEMGAENLRQPEKCETHQETGSEASVNSYFGLAHTNHMVHPKDSKRMGQFFLCKQSYYQLLLTCKLPRNFGACDHGHGKFGALQRVWSTIDLQSTLGLRRVGVVPLF